jgi:glycosyltransferase involved in cell wall biosynthesis
MPPRASLIVSTYNRPRLLDLSLRSFAQQSSLDFELLVADFGSGLDTAECVHARMASSRVRLEHVPQAGGRRADALNRAVLRSRGAYLIFVGGDSLVPSRFVQTHLRARRPRRYLVGGCVPGSAGDTERAEPLALRLADFVRYRVSATRIALGWPAKPDPQGQNFSVDRESFFRVNGYDQSLSDPARQDLDLFRRLQAAGLRPRALGAGSRVRLLDPHPRGVRLGPEEAPADEARSSLELEALLGLRELAGSLRSEIGATATPSSSRSI